MRVIARQIWWLQVTRVTIGCAVIAMGVLTPWLGVEQGLRHGNWQAFQVFLPAGFIFVVLGIVFAIYARLEWRPRGFAVGVTRRGLILKANGFRCPRLVVIRWDQVLRARFHHPSRFSIWPGRVTIDLYGDLPVGTLPTERGGIVQQGPRTIVLYGLWELWLPEDAAALITDAAANPSVRAAL